MAPRSLFPLDSFDPSATVASLADIRQANPQRFEMEQLSRICHVDVEAGQVAGVLEIPAEPFWSRGHIPGRPLMPGVLMIEAAAQLCSYLVRQIYDPALFGERFFGFGGLDGVKFRGVVLPDQDLLLLGHKAELRPRRAVFDTQGWIGGKMAFQATITGLWV